LGQGLSLAEIGRRFGLHESTVGYWVEKHGLQAAKAEKHAARGGIARGELEVLLEEGKSISQIAEAVGRGKTTVRHWLTEYGLKTNRAVQRNTLLETEQQIGGIVTRECPHHGLTEFKRRSAGGHRCLKCRSDAVTRCRRKVKQILVDEAGGRCALCGYSRCMAALEFHHLIPADKRFSLSHRGVARSLDKARDEASKCALLCANCHAEVEAGLIELTPQDSACVESDPSPGLLPG
jgi:transposase